jgi:prevent-host-death family protein
MAEVGIRALKQNASAVVARAAAGEVVVITDRGRPVAQLTPIPRTRLEQMIADGRLIPPTRDIKDLPYPAPRTAEEEGVSLSETLRAMRDDERY